MSKNIVVIGGGPAGMICAGVCASKGNTVTLLEKNSKLGKKLAITGKGRCNITNASDVIDILDNIPENNSFMYSSLYTLDSSAVMAFFESLGVNVKVERGNRVFPVSDKASDVVDALAKYMAKNKVKVITDCEAKQLIIENNKIKGVINKRGKTYLCDSAVITTGGLSYPGTGSTGDGYALAKAAGHTITKLHPSLVPLICCESCNWVTELQGLSLKNVSLSVFVDDKEIFNDFGEMLFTHFGLSGPIVLSASRKLTGLYDKKPILSIDLKPALTERELDARILRDFNEYKNKNFINSLDDLLPQKLIPVFVELTSINPHKKVNEITKEERKKIVSLLKGLKVTVKGNRGFKEALVTAGGVSVTEIDPSTMESKLINGLYFAGEVIDIDGYTGGFNLQIAFSTGYLAGISI